MTAAMVTNCASPAGDSVTQRMERALHIHLDSQWGSPYWIERARACGVTSPQQIKTIDDLAQFGVMTQAALRQRPLLDFIPRQFHDRMCEFVVVQTGGTTGPGAWTAYRIDEFVEAFVQPFVAAAEVVDFPRNEQWLFLGPSGPHVIGSVAPHLARAMGSAHPFSVDFDPRWARRLAKGSLAARRYLDHVLAQAVEVIQMQDIGVLFATPPVVTELAVCMTAAQRDRIRAIHYGGVALERQSLDALSTTWFPNALHLSGYGNTLFGCCLELTTEVPRHVDYFPYGDRLLFQLCVAEGCESEARVCFSRFDESFLIVRMIERDTATLVMPPAWAPRGFDQQGIRDPRPCARDAAQVSGGLY